MPSFRFGYRISLTVIALMSGPFSLIREVLQIIDPVKYPDRPLFLACLWAAFMLAMFLLWLDENQAKRKAEKTLNDNRPILGMNVNGVDGQRAWREHGVPVTFTVQHLAGRVPTSIRFEPILSKQGKFTLCFDALPHAERLPQRTPMRYEVIEVGAPRLSAKDWETTRPLEKEMLMQFIGDSPKNLIELDYPLIARFKDGEDQISHTFHLRFNTGRFGFSEDTTP
ncbi:MAG: hypothetical protein ABSE55_06070 [Terracidiphilus sp.]|jgi:hypothetical protein